MSEKKLRWGVISTSNIGRVAVSPAIQASSNGELLAVCSRNEPAARAFAEHDLFWLEEPTIPDDYEGHARIARDGGLGIVPHAGEGAGPDSVREVMTMDPARIRHGIRAVEEPALLAEIVDRGVVLDVCPTSNLCLGGIPDVNAHPLPALRAAGAQCTINTDDPAMFDTDLGREYEIAERLGVSAGDAYRAGLAGALCDDATRDRLGSSAVA